jgi:Cu+-exporting ATPase
MMPENTIELTEKPAASASVPTRTQMAVSGMTCGNCARHVTEAIQSVPGVRSALVALDSGTASVRWEADTEHDVARVLRAIEEAGYEAKVLDGHPHAHAEHKLAGWQLNLWMGALGTGLLMLGEWAFGLGMRPWFQWFAFGLAAIVQVVAGAPFYRGGWNQLKAGSANMDLLVVLGSTTAFGYSAWALLANLGGHLYFMEAAAIISLISLGHWLESRATARASGALRQLLDLAPPRARRRDANAAEIEVPVSDLEIGDCVVLRPGDRVPTDGEVTEGESVVDESMLTGESAPSDKEPKNLLYAGTVNLNGRMVMHVTATGEETALAQIINAVERAQTSRANIQRLGDRVSSVFVPIVVAVALAAGLWWGLAPQSAGQVHAWLGQFLGRAHAPEGSLAAGFIIAAAVLIIACPCAMGLATPAAIMAGTNAAAARGILIRDGVALEKAGKITAVLFDKTGTLTVGRPSAEVVWERGTDAASYEDQPSERPAAVLAAALARHSNHPVSQAVAKLGSGEIELSEWTEVSGGGVMAKLLRGRRGIARLGSLRWLRESGVEVGEAQKLIAELSVQGVTLVGVAVEQSLRGLLAVRDTLKPGASRVIAQLQQQGAKTYLVSGDNAPTAVAIARQTGIRAENVFAEIRPEQKAEIVKRLQQQGERVAFVGDGINDAPALEQADLGIAVSRASDIAREAADIILLKSEIEAVPESLGLARATLRTIKQNLFWAFFYNAVGVPLAALGFISPILCAAAMGLSDMVVIGNALRLRNWKGR